MSLDDEVLRRRLTRLGLGPKVVRRQPDGDDLDIEALIDLFVDLRAGHSPPEHVYLERRKLDRNLGVLILVDASGSATESDGPAAPSTSTNGGPLPPWPSRSRSSATGSPSTASAPTAEVRSTSSPSSRSHSPSAPADAPG